jgi:hypothetical protein
MAKTMERLIVGTNHRVTRSTINVLRDSLPMKAKLIREPENAHDGNAVMVWLDEKPWKMQIGYLMREVAAEFAPLLDSGRLVVLEAHVTSLDPADGTGILFLKVKAGKGNGSTKRKIRT